MEYVTGGLQDVGNVAGTYNGVNRGNLAGYLGASSNAASLAGRLGGSSSLQTYGGDVGALAAILQGLQHGGWQGDTNAALGAARLGANTGALPASVGQYAGYLGIPLAAYDFAKYGTQSGRTGSDALTGAESGAEIGSAFAPGIGTLLGGLIGGAAGAVASAFGPGAEDPENMQWNQYASAYDKNPQIAGYLAPNVAYQNLAGVMDARDNTPGHSEPIEQTFGRMGEQNLMDQLTGYLNQEYKSGAIKPGESVGQQWTSTIDPWLQSRGATIDPNQNTVKGAPEGNALTGDLQSLIGDWESGELTPQSKVGINGQTIGGLTQFAGETPQESQFWAKQAAQQQAAQSEQGNQSMRGVARAARGGQVNSKLARLKALLAAPPMSSQPVRHFDAGGYVDYYNIGNDFSDPSSFDLTQQNLDSLNSASDFNPDLSYYGQSGYDSPGLENYTEPSSGVLGALAAGGKDVGSVLSALKGYAPLIPLIGALTGATNPKAPSVPNLPNNSITPIATPSYSRSPVAAPTNSATHKPMTTQDWYTYGERPEASFFGNSQLPYVAGMSPANQAPTQGYLGAKPYMGVAHGGEIEFDGSQGPHVRGPGDGTSDDIPARLSDGEYVFDAGSVAALGNGSNEAGARRLDQMRQNIRKDAGKRLVKGKQFMKAKAPEQYLSEEKD
jgi:hypothetical protein